MKQFLKKVYLSFPQPRFTRFRNLKLFEWMNQHACGKRVLNLGSGEGTFDLNLSKEINTIRLDIDPSKPNLDVIADAHYLPFKTESLDIIYSIAVLEHVKKPWIVADEMARVLCSGGHLVLELPFLNIIHDKHDYFRFTDKGIRSLFDEKKFDVVFEQVSAGGGSFLSVFLLTYFRQFIPSKIGKKIWSFLLGYSFSLCKYLDVLINNSRELRLTANSFTFIGKKRWLI